MQIFGLVAFSEQKENDNYRLSFSFLLDKSHEAENLQIVIVFFLLAKGHEAENLQKRVFVFIALPLPYGGLQWIIWILIIYDL